MTPFTTSKCSNSVRKKRGSPPVEMDGKMNILIIPDVNFFNIILCFRSITAALDQHKAQRLYLWIVGLYSQDHVGGYCFL